MSRCLAKPFTTVAPCPTFCRRTFAFWGLPKDRYQTISVSFFLFLFLSCANRLHKDRRGAECLMSEVFELSHPLVKHHLTVLRDRRTRPAEFRALIQRLAVLLAYEATADLQVEPVEIETPLTR